MPGICAVSGSPLCEKDRQRAEPVLSPKARLAWIAFQRASTQWRMGFDGPTGLDYTAGRSIDPEAWDMAFPLIQQLEAERLNLWSEERERQRLAEENKRKKR